MKRNHSSKTASYPPEEALSISMILRPAPYSFVSYLVICMIFLVIWMNRPTQGKIERRLREIGIELPDLKVIGKISAAEVVGNLAFCSGHGCEDTDGELRLRGKVRRLRGTSFKF